MDSPVLFISYSSHDRDRLDNLVSALRRARDEVWFDDELGGGEMWWQMILDHIRGCDVFVFAMSDDSLKSKACRAELNYAQALGKPVLPVQIGPVESMRVTPLAAVETIDFRDPTVDSGIRLITAIREAELRSTALPSPLPEEPPVPYAYLIRAAAAVNGAELAPQDQEALLFEIKNALREDDGDPAACRDIAQLLHTLRDRPDATAQTRSESDGLLKTLGEISRPALPPRASGSKKWLIAAAAVLVCLVAAAAIVVLTRTKSAPTTARPSTAGSSGSAAASSGSPAPTDASTAGPTSAPVLPPQKLESILLSVDEIGAITGVPNLTADPVQDGPFDSPPDFSDPDCIGADIVAAAAAYQGSGYARVRAQSLNAATPGDPDTPLSFVEQAAVSFPSSELATAFLNKSEQRWRGCTGRVVQQTSDSGSFTWTYLDVARNENTISQLSTQEDGDGWDCQHTLTAHSNLILEAVACARDIQNYEANRIVARMVEKTGA